MLKYTSLLLAGAALAGCASTPDVTYTYYLAKSRTIASVTRTVTCTDSKAVISYGEPKVDTTYVADFTRPQKVTMEGFNGAFADNTFNLSLTDDGRLKAVDAASTGQGGKVLQSMISLGTAIAALGAGAHGMVEDKSTTPCGVIAKHTKNGTSIDLTYTNALAPADLGGKLPARGEFTLSLPDGSDSQTIDGDLSQAGVPMSAIVLRVQQERAEQDMIAVNGSKTYSTNLTLQKIAHAHFQVVVGGTVLSTGSAVVPRTDGDNDTYSVPVTSAKLFGGTTFKLTLSDSGSGSPTEIGYGDTQGVDQAVSSVTNIITAATPQTVPPPPPPQ